MEVATASPLVVHHIISNIPVHKLPSSSPELLLLSSSLSLSLSLRRTSTGTHTSSVGSVVVGGVNSSSDSMSQGFHRGIFSFSDGFQRTTTTGQDEQQQQQQQQHVAQQSRREKLRVQGFDPSLVPLQGGGGDDEQDDGGSIYEQSAASSGAGNMLSEMFNFRAAAGPSASDLLASQMQQAGYRLPSSSARPPVPGFGDWYGGPHNNHRDHGMVLGGTTSSSADNLSSIPAIGDDHAKQLNAESAAVMQLFSMNPLQSQLQQQRSPSSPSEASLQGLHHHHHHHHHQQQQQHHHDHHHHHQGFAAAGSFSTSHHDHHQASSSFIDRAAAAAAAAAGMVEGQAGLSLSLSSSLHQLEMAKTHHDQELSVRDGVLYFNSNAAAAAPANSNNDQQPQQQQLQNPACMFQLHGQAVGPGQHVHMAAGYGPAAAATVGVVNVLRNSKYSRAAQELLEEFCSVGRGQFKGVGRPHHHHYHSSSTNPNPNPAASTSTSAAGPSSTNSVAKDQPPALSPADRFEQQRNKSKLLSMLDEASYISFFFLFFFLLFFPSFTNCRSRQINQLTHAT